MDIYELSYPLESNDFNSIVIAIGFFDGVHLGHQKVINEACKTAKKMDLPCGIMTFTPHPKQVMGEKIKIDQITPNIRKLKEFEKLNIDVSYIVNFTKEFAKISPEEFVEFLLQLNVKGVIVGFDFTFGYKGLGTATTLKELAKGRFTVDIVEPFFYEDEKVSSTRIRDNLLNGNIEVVNKLLGRNYSFAGKVVQGFMRGRTIGFPTANLQLLDDYLPIKNGVYVVKVQYHNTYYSGVMNVGYKPTFFDDNSNHTYEIYIIDFSEDIYDEVLEVEVLDFIREEKKFDSIEGLKQQIKFDVQNAKNIMLNIC